MSPPLLPRSNMHRCLNISELLIQIFDYCALDDLKSVAVLARSCRAFQDSALEVLWRELEDISPLIRMLPSHLWRQVKSVNNAGHVIITLVSLRGKNKDCWEAHGCYDHSRNLQRTRCQPMSSGREYISMHHAYKSLHLVTNVTSKAAECTGSPGHSCRLLADMSVGDLAKVSLFSEIYGSSIWTSMTIANYTFLNAFHISPAAPSQSCICIVTPTAMEPISRTS